MTRGKLNSDACSHAGCDTRAWGNGLCQKHYTRQRRRGITDDPTIPSEVERFWGYVDKSDGCWTWCGHRGAKGYGQFTREGGRFELAHRYAYAETFGPIPKGLHLDHLCRNPSCVRPAHLEAVTPRENTMRGIGPSAVNARKTHCIRGHEFSVENTYLKGARRVCRECTRAYDRARRGSLRRAR